MRITTLASVVIPCLGFSASSIAAAEDVMIVSASGYEKKLTNAAASVSVISQEELRSLLGDILMINSHLETSLFFLF